MKKEDLRILLDRISDSPKWEEAVEINNFVTCFIRPLTYRHLTNTSLKTFEAQRLLQAATNDEITEEHRQTIYNQSIQIMSEVAINLLVDSVKSVQTPTALVKEREYIKEFLENCERSVWEAIKEKLDAIKTATNFNDVTLECENPPCGKEFVTPFIFEQSNFFG